MLKNPLFWLGVLWNLCADAWGEEVASSTVKQSARVVSHADVAQWSMALLMVLAIFGGLVWLLRKSGHLPFADKNQLAVVAGLSLGVREKVVLIKVGDKQLLLGVTPGRVDKLLELEGDQRLFINLDQGGDAGSFARKLQQVMRGNGANG